MELNSPFQKDKNGLYFVNSSDVTIKEISMPRYRKPYGRYQIFPSFYKVLGMNEYIIKECRLYPIFNRIRNLNLLKELTIRQDMFPDISFPFAYFKESVMIKGIFSIHYENAPSIQQIICEHSFSELKDYYDHEIDEEDNLISLFLDVLHILMDLYIKSIYYVDVRTSNFVIYNNSVKILDFEPGLVLFSDPDGIYLKRILLNYSNFVNETRKRFGFKEIVFESGKDFYETEKNILEYRNKLERCRWNLKEKSY